MVGLISWAGYKLITLLSGIGAGDLRLIGAAASNTSGWEFWMNRWVAPVVATHSNLTSVINAFQFNWGSHVSWWGGGAYSVDSFADSFSATGTDDLSGLVFTGGASHFRAFLTYALGMWAAVLWSDVSDLLLEVLVVTGDALW